MSEYSLGTHIKKLESENAALRERAERAEGWLCELLHTDWERLQRSLEEFRAGRYKDIDAVITSFRESTHPAESETP